MGVRVFFIFMLLTLTCSACSRIQSKEAAVYVREEDSAYNIFDSAPKVKPDGSKYKIAFVDEDPYPITAEMVYYVLESLKDDGWIEFEEMPFEMGSLDAVEMLNWLADRDLGPYIEFDRQTNYYILIDGEEYVRESLKEHVLIQQDVDMIFASGTLASGFCKELDLPVPLLMYACVDPVSSGLVESEEDSGKDNIWAHIGKSDYKRQLSYYYDIFGFSNIGIIYYDEAIASIADYRAAAAEKGFRITEMTVPPLEGDQIDVYYEQLKQAMADMAKNPEIDAFLLTTNLIRDEERTEEYVQGFYEHHIPVLVQYGEGFVENGALLLVQPLDYKGIAPFCSYVIGSVLNGAMPRELPQEYISSPYLVLNLDVSEKTGFKPSFDMLLSSEKIIARQAGP